jgi:NOL1/NOP2/fmu family ribosome biogenesis protein
MGKMASRDLVPDHELALSLVVNKDRFLQTELTREQAIQYLRRDNISALDIDDKGWSLMNFEGQPLGWAKLLPNRINNYYPKEIRIMTSP